MGKEDSAIKELLDSMTPITLEEMSDIRLMNRLDTKYVASKAQLVQLLGLVQDKYYVQLDWCRISIMCRRLWRGVSSPI